MSPTDDHTEDDEIVSAVLDGEATPDEVGLVERDPALRARLEELRAVAAQVAAPVDPLPDATVRSLVEAALAAADLPLDEGDADDAGDGGDRPDELADRRARRRTSATRWLAAAAVLVALAGVGAQALDGSSSEDRASMETAGSAVGDAADAPDAASSDDRATGAADDVDSHVDGSSARSTTTVGDAPSQGAAAENVERAGVPGFPHAGALDGPDDVRTWARTVGVPATGFGLDELDDAVANRAPTPADVEPCADIGTGTTIGVAEAEYRGVAVRLALMGRPDADQAVPDDPWEVTVVVLDDDCTVVDEVPLRSP